jgi:hypothetical protein
MVNNHKIGIGYKLNERHGHLMKQFTAKSILLDALRTKLEGSNVERIILHFNIIQNSYNVMVKNSTGGDLKFEIEEKEISMLKRLLINKIKVKYDANNDTDLKAVIIQFDLELDNDDALSIFVEDIKDNVTKFNY